MKILGEEQEVLDATQQLLTISAHRTLNDPNVLDHSMEFATEVVGDDVVQRTGGEALRNTVGYAVQPSGGAGKCMCFHNRKMHARNYTLCVLYNITIS